MKCMNCGKNYSDEIIFNLVDKHGTKCFCPNCSAMMEMEGSLELVNDPDLYCEVLGQFGAVVFSSGNEKYILDEKIMHKLLSYNLEPYEYFILNKTRNALGSNYMIHDDFYDENGIAIQPLEK